MHLLLAALLFLPLTAQQPGTVDFTKDLQRIEGFGFSDAFKEADALRKLTPAQQHEVLDLLFSRKTGAGFSILRLGIGTDSDLIPTPPASPSTPATYAFDNNDGGQLWLAHQAQTYGVTTFLADAWTAPAFMKSNNNKVGGFLCGSPGITCPTGDWRAAYADFLVHYAAAYAKAGVPITSLSFVNEPGENVPYDSMSMTPPQAVDFIKILAPAMAAARLPTKLYCCETTRWTEPLPYIAAIEADPAASAAISTIASHEYGVHATQPLPTQRPVWMTEWSSGSAQFEPIWDCNECPNGPDGMYLAGDILQALNAAHVSAFVYWWGTSTGPAALILTTDTTYTVAARFYAIAGISRFVFPGAHLVPSTSPNPTLKLAAFRNPNGSKVIAILNTAPTPTSTTFTLTGKLHPPQTFLTDATHHLTPTNTSTLQAQTLSVQLPARSLTTILLP